MRWKLMTGHYLNVVTNPSTWEYQETDRTTGRPRRKVMPVPTLLDPRDPNCWTTKWGNHDNEEGEVIVCQGEGLPGDIEFLGDPTPDMVPIDDEAKARSAEFADLWRYKPESSEPFDQSLIRQMEEKFVEVKTAPVEIPGMSDLVAAIGTLVKQNAEVIASPRRL